MPGPAVPLIIAGMSALSSYLANRKKARTSESTSTTDMTDMPQFGPEVSGLNQALISRLLARLQEEPELPDYSFLRGQATRNINQAAGASQTALASRLAERGLSYSPGVVSNVYGTQETARGSALANAMGLIDIEQSQAPLIREELLSRRLQQAGQILPLFRGIQRRGTTTGTQVGAGDPLAAGVGGFSESLALAGGLGLFDRNSNAGGANRMDLSNYFRRFVLKKR